MIFKKIPKDLIELQPTNKIIVRLGHISVSDYYMKTFNN